MIKFKEEDGRKFIVLTDSNFAQEVLENPRPILVQIGASWSGACHIMAPILERVIDDLKGQIRLGKLDIETNERTAKEYGVTELPILLFFKNGQIKDHIVGTISAKRLGARLQTILYMN